MIRNEQHRKGLCLWKKLANNDQGGIWPSPDAMLFHENEQSSEVVCAIQLAFFQMPGLVH